MSVDFSLIYLFLHREYYLFSQNSESSLEQYIFFAFLKKVNNSIATKLRVHLLNNRLKIKLFLVRYTVQGLNCVVRYLNVEIN